MLMQALKTSVEDAEQLVK